MAPAYVPLWCKSNFSFLQGASHPEELVDQAQRLGVPGLALCDRDGVYGVVRAHVKARELGVKLIIGSEISLDDGSQILLLASSHKGYRNLCRLITRGRLRAPKGECRLSWGDVCEHAGDLIALWGGEHSLLVREELSAELSDALRQAFGDRLYALLARHRRAEEREQERHLRTHARRLGLPLVAGSEVLYHSAARRPLHDVLTCIGHGRSLSTAGRLIRPNDLYALHSAQAFAELFADLPRAVERTREVAARCDFSLDQLRYRYPAEELPQGQDTQLWLRELCLRGARDRYALDEGEELSGELAAQIERELGLIHELDYGGYFLTMYEIVQFCRRQGILCQGRGSAANSVVCYCLGITAIDPLRMGLLFERFISRERAEPPDIDLDIAHARREEVIQWVYERYGRARAAMVAVVVRYRTRSALREVGKAFGLSSTGLDRLAKQHGHHEPVDAQALEHSGLDLPEEQRALFVSLIEELRDFPRHLSIHPGGFLLGHEPVHDLVPIENGSMAERTVIQWDKDDVEALGLFKVDLLGLGALTQLDLAFKLLAEHRGVKLSMARIPPRDSLTFDMICRADTVGVFQIESRAQMSMLPRLRPRNFYDLVIEVSIVRPGPISGGMVHPYLRRRRGEEEVVYPHACLKPVLDKTLGVPIFQEQVMKLAMVAADYSPGEADQLRRDMAAWRREGCIERHHQRLVDRMIKKGIAREFAERVFEQIRGFGEYGFPESHAASFALISYASAYLKAHFPEIFTCALLNAQPMGFYSPASLVEDAKRHGVVVLPVDARVSGWDCSLEALSGEITEEHEPRELALRMGLRYVKGLSEAQAQKIIALQGAEAGQGFEAWVLGCDLDRGSLSALAEAGALESFGLSRRQALWEIGRLVHERGQSLPAPSRETVPDFASLDPMQTVSWDYRASLHSPRAHPLQTLRTELHAQGLPDAATVQQLPDGSWVHYAGLVICRQRPGTASGVTFMTLEDESGFVNVVVWQQVYERFRLLLKTEGFIGISGRLQVEQQVVHLVAERLWTPKLGQQPAPTASRDFR